MKHVTSNDNGSTAAKPSIFPELDFDTMNAEEIDSFARSRYGNIGQPAYSDAVSLPPPGGILASNAPGRGPYVNRIEFEMFVLSPSKEKFHNYTSNQTDIGAKSRLLEDIRNWRTSFPRLENYYEQGQLDTDVILIESNLNLLSEYPPKNSTLSIRFMVNVTGVSDNERWTTRADYYENSGQPVDMRTFYAMNNIPKATDWDTPNIFQGSGESDIRLEIPLQSTWWVQLFTKMAARKQEMSHDPYLSQQEDEWSRRYLQEMSIMQELWMNPGVAGALDSRIAIILWKFSPSRAGEAGTTTWRRLKPPPERIKVNSPRPSPAPPLQHSMVLDSALQTLAMPQAVSMHTERFLQNANIFAEDSERIVGEPQSARESASPALSLGYTTSFPSSTSTSFPPSVTHGYLSHEESQESACYSQESDRSRNGSLDAQYSSAFSQESSYTRTESRAYNDDMRYLAENQGIELQDPAFYSQQSLDSLPHFHAQPQYEPYDGEPIQDSSYRDSFTGHDFAGGQIQLSFQYHGLLANAHCPPSQSVPLVEHPFQTDNQTGDPGLHQPTHNLAADRPTATAEDQLQHTDFDFSNLEAHFTSDEIAELRMQDPTYSRHGELGELLQGSEEVQNYDSQQMHSDKSGQQSSMATADRLQIQHGIVLGEVTEEAIENEVYRMDEGLELERGYEEGSQVVDGREQYNGVNAHDYDDHGHGEDASS